jgi:hypothetical protein
MSDKSGEHDPHKRDATKNPARQTGEDKGKIKRPQRTDATMQEKDLPRGSESEHQGGPRTRF